MDYLQRARSGIKTGRLAVSVIGRLNQWFQIPPTFTYWRSKFCHSRDMTTNNIEELSACSTPVIISEVVSITQHEAKDAME